MVFESYLASTSLFGIHSQLPSGQYQMGDLKRYAKMIRSMKIEDAFRVADIHARAWQVAYKGILDQKLLDAINVMEWEEMWRDKLIPNPERTNLVLDVEAKIKGWSALEHHLIIENLRN